ncbi:MAG: 2-dehydropantoate 2-reductase [Clostridia bacterium]|nr:2-dehydropantoate 2-reductase [Clostridia bacterium]
MMARYAIYGAGSLGTVLGAFITKNGGQVDLINRNKAHVETLNTKGAKIIGTVDMTVPVKAITPDQMEGKYDVIVLLTKQLFNKEVVTMLKDYLTDDGVVVTLQNGIPEPGIAEIIGTEHTMGCAVEWGAALVEPGVCELTSDKDSLSFHMGKMDGITDAQFKTVKDLLEMMCPVHEEENLMGARWSKLLINSTFSGLGTVVGGVFGDVTENKAGQKVAIRCMKEIIDVGHASGVQFAPVQGKNIVSLFYWKGALKRAFGCFLLPIALKKHRDIEPSMLQDLKKGKPCEVDAINGVVCDFGRKYNVKTPINDRIVEVIKKIQNGELKAEAKNINLFDDLL